MGLSGSSDGIGTSVGCKADGSAMYSDIRMAFISVGKLTQAWTINTDGLVLLYLVVSYLSVTAGKEGKHQPR